MYGIIFLKTLFFFLLIACLIFLPSECLYYNFNKDSNNSFINSRQYNLLNNSNIQYIYAYMRTHRFQYRQKCFNVKMDDKYEKICSKEEYKCKRIFYEKYYTKFSLSQNENKGRNSRCYKLFYNGINYKCKKYVLHIILNTNIFCVKLHLYSYFPDLYYNCEESKNPKLQNFQHDNLYNPPLIEIFISNKPIELFKLSLFMMLDMVSIYVCNNNKLLFKEKKFEESITDSDCINNINYDNTKDLFEEDKEKQKIYSIGSSLYSIKLNNQHTNNHFKIIKICSNNLSEIKRSWLKIKYDKWNNLKFKKCIENLQHTIGLLNEKKNFFIYVLRSDTNKIFEIKIKLPCSNPKKKCFFFFSTFPNYIVSLIYYNGKSTDTNNMLLQSKNSNNNKILNIFSNFNFINLKKNIHKNIYKIYKENGFLKKHLNNDHDIGKDIKKKNIHKNSLPLKKKRNFINADVAIINKDNLAISKISFSVNNMVLFLHFSYMYLSNNSYNLINTAIIDGLIVNVPILRCAKNSNSHFGNTFFVYFDVRMIDKKYRTQLSANKKKKAILCFLYIFYSNYLNEYYTLGIYKKMQNVVTMSNPFYSCNKFMPYFSDLDKTYLSYLSFDKFSDNVVKKRRIAGIHIYNYTLFDSFFKILKNNYDRNQIIYVSEKINFYSIRIKKNKKNTYNSQNILSFQSYINIPNFLFYHITQKEKSEVDINNIYKDYNNNEQIKAILFKNNSLSEVSKLCELSLHNLIYLNGNNKNIVHRKSFQKYIYNRENDKKRIILFEQEKYNGNAIKSHNHLLKISDMNKWGILKHYFAFFEKKLKFIGIKKNVIHYKDAYMKINQDSKFLTQMLTSTEHSIYIEKRKLNYFLAYFKNLFYINNIKNINLFQQNENIIPNLVKGVIHKNILLIKANEIQHHDIVEKFVMSSALNLENKLLKNNIKDIRKSRYLHETSYYKNKINEDYYLIFSDTRGFKKMNRSVIISTQSIYHIFYRMVCNSKFYDNLYTFYRNISNYIYKLSYEKISSLFKNMKKKKRLLSDDSDENENDSELDVKKEADSDSMDQKFHRAHSKNNTIQYFKCFLDKAAENVNTDNEMLKWVNPVTNSCYCSEENAEPCSTYDISDGNFVGQLMDNSFCNLKNPKIISELFMVLSNYKKLHCGHKNNDDYIAEPISQNELYKYCKFGLTYWDNKQNYEYMNCETVKSKEDKYKNSCKEKCEQIKLLCNENAQFYSFEICKRYYEYDETKQGIYNKNFQFFDDHCSYFDPSNRGLVLCKHKNVECDYSEWSEWTSCSKSCRENDYDSDVLKTRVRVLLKSALYAGKACSVFVSDNNKLMDVRYCSELPYCNPNLNVEEQDRIPPFAIPLEEIKKANTLNDLNNNDNDLLNENILGNDKDTLTDCVVTDMYKYKDSIGYNEKMRSCSCPSYENPCYFKDIYNSSSWKYSLEKLCKKDPNINVLTADYVLIGCDMSISFKKKEVAVNTYLSMTFDCQSSLFQYLFCSKSNESYRTNFIYIIITCIFGGISAIYMIHLIINNSGKLKMLLGLNEKKQLDKHSNVESEDEECSTDAIKESDENQLNGHVTSNNEGISTDANDEKKAK